MSKWFLLLPAALLVNLGLFWFMYVLVAPQMQLPEKTPLLPLSVERVVLPAAAPPPTMPKPPVLPAPLPLSAPPAVVPPPPTSPQALPDLPPLPDLPALPLSLPPLAIQKQQPFLGDMTVTTPTAAPAATESRPTAPPPKPSFIAPKPAPTAPVATRKMVQADRNLVPLLKTQPKYPRLAQRRGIEGRVEIEFVINPQGAVEDVSLIQAEPPEVFEEAALQAVKQWKFAPKFIEGAAVYQKARQVIEFKLH